MLTTEEIHGVIEQERNYQDTTYPIHEMTNNGLGPTRYERDKDITPHLVLLRTYITKAETDWATGGSSQAAIKQVAKIAAIAVRALERVNGSDVVLGGLR